jgi:hypoxanthine phosphoribosyltransferase
VTTKKEQYSWGEFEDDSEKIAAWAKDGGFNGVYGIPRGGLVLAVRLSHLLEIPLILGRDDITKNTLIVDDIVDSGGTMERLLGSLGKNFRIAVIYYDRGATIKPDFFVREKTKWVVFPWETKKSSRYDGTI